MSDMTSAQDIDARLGAIETHLAKLISTGGSWDRIPFGPRPTQVLLPEVASDMLTALCEQNRALFGKLLSNAMTEPRGASDGHRA
jgi:hypothetical protein